MRAAVAALVEARIGIDADHVIVVKLHDKTVPARFGSSYSHGNSLGA